MVQEGSQDYVGLPGPLVVSGALSLVLSGVHPDSLVLLGFRAASQAGHWALLTAVSVLPGERQPVLVVVSLEAGQVTSPVVVGELELCLGAAELQELDLGVEINYSAGLAVVVGGHYSAGLVAVEESHLMVGVVSSLLLLPVEIIPRLVQGLARHGHRTAREGQH